MVEFPQRLEKKMITKEEVKHVAKLARLELTDSEIEKYSEQLGNILTYVFLYCKKIQKIFYQVKTFIKFVI